jgi:integral membrane protein
VNAALTRFRVMAYVTGVMLIVLLIGTAIRLIADDRTLVSIVGPAHGFLYMVYLVTAFDLAVRAKWRFVRTVLVLLAGTVPFVSFYAERKATAWVRTEASLGAPGEGDRAAAASGS